MLGTRYDAIGAEYAATRREDPRIAALIHAALGDARTIVNVGAGAGSYEPRDREVVAVEPSEVMLAQRDPGGPPAIIGGAYPLPFEDRSMDAAMAILTIHHWDEDRERGVREMRRVASGPVVILTYDPEVSGRMWLMADYLPEVAELDRRIFPSLDALTRWLDAEVTSGRCRFRATRPTGHSVLSGRTPSGFSTPRRAMRLLASRGCLQRWWIALSGAVARDLEDGTWDARHGHLRELDEYDAGLRLRRVRTGAG